jgi:hypothetical protein
MELPAMPGVSNFRDQSGIAWHLLLMVCCWSAIYDVDCETPCTVLRTGPPGFLLIVTALGLFTVYEDPIQFLWDHHLGRHQ